MADETAPVLFWLYCRGILNSITVETYLLKTSIARLNREKYQLVSTQWAKGYHFDPKFSKYFFHFTLGQKISKVIVLS